MAPKLLKGTSRYTRYKVNLLLSYFLKVTIMLNFW